MSTTTIENQLAEHRTCLLRYARLQLRNAEWAEDAVSETLLAALAKPQSFGNRSQLKTWLVGILKHKVIDILRQRSREVWLAADEGDGSEELEALVLKADGHFMNEPSDWGDPEQELNSRQFFAVLEACTDKLPPAMARVFLMRDWLELPSEEICKELQLTATNLHVQLHRARLRLRECPELNCPRWNAWRCACTWPPARPARNSSGRSSPCATFSRAGATTQASEDPPPKRLWRLPSRGRPRARQGRVHGAPPGEFSKRATGMGIDAAQFRVFAASSWPHPRARDANICS